MAPNYAQDQAAVSVKILYEIDHTPLLRLLLLLATGVTFFMALLVSSSSHTAPFSTWALYFTLLAICGTLCWASFRFLPVKK